MTAKEIMKGALLLRQEQMEEMKRMAELLRRVLREVDERQKQLEDLQDTILRLALTVPDPTERRVLFHRCFCGMSWSQIGEKLGISESSARRRYRAALEHVSMPGRQ